MSLVISTPGFWTSFTSLFDKPSKTSKEHKKSLLSFVFTQSASTSCFFAVRWVHITRGGQGRVRRAAVHNKAKCDPPLLLFLTPLPPPLPSNCSNQGVGTSKFNAMQCRSILVGFPNFLNVASGLGNPTSHKSIQSNQKSRMQWWIQSMIQKMQSVCSNHNPVQSNEIS